MDLIGEFIESGYVEFGSIIPEDACQEMVRKVLATRQFDDSLFFSEAEFLQVNPDAFNKNPRPGCNILESLETELDAVESNPILIEFLERLLGPDYSIFRKKLVCGMPEANLPRWILERVEGMPSNNLAHFVKPEFTDITYFYGIDFHQDIVDWKGRKSDFVTVYVYLESVGPKDAPLFVVPESQILGANCFPHDLEPINASMTQWRYRADDGQTRDVRHKIMTGAAGHTACWHPLTLHGTEPDLSDHPRLSLRYLIERGQSNGVYGIDRANERVKGPLGTPRPREDLDERGLAIVRSNRLFQYSRATN